MNFLEKMLSYIFPPTCGICGKLGEGYLCKNCMKQLTNSNIFLNQIELFSKQNSNYLKEHFYLFKYSGIIREKIIEYKFNNKAYLADMFCKFLVKNEKLCGFLKKYDIICSIPISNKRKTQRGYNQSELIARKIAKFSSSFCNIKFNNRILIKVKDNKPQSSLNKIQRLENVKNVYKIQNIEKIKNKNVLLFDDIYTTGATVNECAKLLKQASCKCVGIMTIAKD